MRDSAALFEAVVEVRDVVESFLANDIVVADWYAMLSTAADQFATVGDRSADADLLELADEIHALLRVGLPESAQLARAVSERVGHLLDEVTPPELMIGSGPIREF